ncbi:MAG: P1 family peptidase [Clostridiales bacterium]|nr:P1 family peptidase [Clostridiales bacterium]
MYTIPFTDIDEIKLGHEEDLENLTGCTVLLCESGAVAGVDVRGGAPGTRETDLLNPMNLIDKIHAILLSGGSAFGLDAAGGVMQYLEEKDIGFDVGVAKVPIVTGAVLFDLAVGNPKIRPDKDMGYRACINANNQTCPEGNIGAGTGATVGKFLGLEYAMKGGLGCYALQVGDLKVGAVVAVNAFGDVINPKTGEIIAGTLNADKTSFANTSKSFLSLIDKNQHNLLTGNTTIGIIATNAKINKSQANKIASMTHDAYARTIRPVHTMADGDTIFALGTGKVTADINVIGVLANEVMEMAILRAIKSANSVLGIKAYEDIHKA